MDALVSNVSVVGAELVKAVSNLNPDSNLVTILEQTNSITNQRLVNTLRLNTFTTVFHLIEAIWIQGLSEENASQVLTLISKDQDFPESLRSEVQKIIDSGLLNSVYKYVVIEEPVLKKCCYFF